MLLLDYNEDLSLHVSLNNDLTESLSNDTISFDTATESIQACMGIYADVHHGRMIFLEEEKVNRVSKNSKDKEKYKKLIAEYRKFKAENVKHFRLNVSASLDNFGRLRSPCITTNLKSNSL